MTKDNKITESSDLDKALDVLKTKREEKGIIPKSDKKTIIVNGKKEFTGKSLKIDKGLFKDGQNYTYRAGTKWADIDVFGKKNISFAESDFI